MSITCSGRSPELYHRWVGAQFHPDGVRHGFRVRLHGAARELVGTAPTGRIPVALLCRDTLMRSCSKGGAV